MTPSRASLWLPPVSVMALIFTISCFSHVPVPKLPFLHPDKVAHALVYGLLGFLLARAARFSWRWTWPKVVLFALLISSFFGATDEWHQSFVPGRSVEATDWLADTVGALFGQIPAYFRYRRGG